MKNSLLVTIVAFLLACQPTKKLVWSDEFNVDGMVDTARWNFDSGDGCPTMCGWGNNEAQFYTNQLKNIRVENGNLIVEAHKDSLNGKAFTSSRIVSKHKGDWLYGRIEVSAKLPKGRGTWPAIWMLPTDWKYGGWPTSGEIDIMEHVGYDQGVIHGTLHSKKYNHIQQTQQEGKFTVADCSEQFHLYAIDWNKDRIDFLIDGQPYHSVKRNSADTFEGWPFDQRFHIILNIAVGGNWGGKEGIDEMIWPQKMEIDYVKVYQ